MRSLRFTQQETYAYPDLQSMIRDRLPRRARDIHVTTTYTDGVRVVFDIEPHPRTVLTRHASRTARLKPRWQRATQGATA